MRVVQSKFRTDHAEPGRDEIYAEVLAEAISIVEANEIPYLAAGSMASLTWGRPGPMGDVDLLIDPRSAKPLLKAFEEAGFETDETFPQWLFKAKKNGITVDLIFEMAGPLYLEPQMLERGSMVEIHGTKLRIISPEDYVLSQALALKEDTAVYWFNALGVIGRQEMDWEYIIDMAHRGPRMILALLLLGQAHDLPIPDSVIRRIFANSFPESS
ncbi:MAG TPA: nucleotidyltransferase [Actinomycetota bacterium]|nr:nucleotidyltransferase [Actinomycetota bacterium]